MFSKILIGSGILIFAVGVAAIVWKIHGSLGIFSARESAGVGAVGGSLIFVVLIPIGIIFVIVGSIKHFKDTKTLK